MGRAFSVEQQNNLLSGCVGQRFNPPTRSHIDKHTIELTRQLVPFLDIEFRFNEEYSLGLHIENTAVVNIEPSDFKNS